MFFRCDILPKVRCCKSLENGLFCREINSRRRRNSLIVFHRNSLKYSNDQRGKLDWNWLIFYLKLYRERHTALRRRHYSAELQTAKQTLTSSKNSIESTYSDFPCDLEVIEINLRWLIVYGNVKRARDWRLPPVHSGKLDQHDYFTRPVSRRYRDRTNQIAGFVTVPSWEEIINFIPFENDVI